MYPLEQIRKDLVDQIKLFRKLHQSSYVSPSDELNQLANRWVQQLTADGTERIHPYSIYGQPVCSNHTENDIVKACAAKWYGAVKFFDWADPKMTVKSSPFTQMVWKNSTRIGVGISWHSKGSWRCQGTGYRGKIFHICIF